ncbi:GNAT family N-acetyltransferase [Bacteroidota bacterium]|nr:GNAT family N-acetyltransferase [Bacteroidota bacterium]
MYVKIVDVDSILELRRKVLRHGKPFESCFYKEDRIASTIHLAGVIKNTIVSCATFYSEKNNHIAHKNSFRLRGMATEEKFRKKGFGKLLLKTAEKIISEKGSNNLWCNARIKAVPFYLSCGYKIIGQLFDIQYIGPHYMMYKNI